MEIYLNKEEQKYLDFLNTLLIQRSKVFTLCANQSHREKEIRKFAEGWMKRMNLSVDEIVEYSDIDYSFTFSNGSVIKFILQEEGALNLFLKSNG